MAYITYDDIIARTDRLPELVPEGLEIEAWVSRLIESADGLIDARLGAAYAVPLTNPPAVIQTIAYWLVMYEALRENYSAEEVERNEWVERYYDQAMSLLDAMVEGGSLDVATGDHVASTTTNVARTITRTAYDTERNPLEYGTWESVW